MNIFLTLCNLLVCVFASGPTTDYCFVNCVEDYHDTHLVCQRYHRCPKPKGCIEHEATKHWRQTMLHILNDARNAAANGSRKFNFGNSGAKVMNALSYDMELEYIITCYQNNCDEPIYHGCLQSVRFRASHIACALVPGQLDNNLWLTLVNCREQPSIYLKYLTYEGVKTGSDFYFSRLFGWKSKFVGCAATTKHGVWATVACLFGPTTLSDELVYKLAKHPNEIASECEEGRNKKYPALCGEIDEVPSGTMWSHLNITANSSRNIFCVYSLCKSIMIYMIICSLFQL